MLWGLSRAEEDRFLFLDVTKNLLDFIQTFNLSIRAYLGPEPLFDLRLKSGAGLMTITSV